MMITKDVSTILFTISITQAKLQDDNNTDDEDESRSRQLPKKPAKASIATRPCLSSASLNLMNSFSVSGQRARGSKKPNGAVTPASPLGSKTVFGKAETHIRQKDESQWRNHHDKNG